MGGARGSKVLITTRTKLVATVSGANSLYPLEGLSKKESWSLFKQMAFKEENELQNACRVEIGKEIVKKCAGVPLAIRVLGSLLYSRDTKEEWLSFRNKDMPKIAQDENIVLPILKLSYDHFPWHLKQCFAFCCFYLKDHVIDKQQLIQLWCAHRFIGLSNENQEMEDVGDLYFIELLRRSFFQDERIDEFGNIISCKMHDLIHDVAVLVAKSESLMVNLSTKEVPPRIHHVSIDLPSLNDRPWEIPAPLLGAIGIRTFFWPAQGYYSTVSYDVERENSVYAKIVSTFKRLRVLDLHKLGFQTVPSCISKLTHLRYLDLSGNSGIKTLPNSITELPNLQTLKLSHCESLERLPREIRKLVRLRHLEIDGCHGLSDMPRGLGELTCLRTLKEFKVGPSNRLSELKDLNNLRGKLLIELPRMDLRRDQSIEVPRRPRLKEAEEANLKEKQHLQSLRFDFGNFIYIDDDDGELKSVLEALRPHTNLKMLEITGYRGVRLPTWMSFLLNLVQIYLHNCNGCKNLPKFEQRPCLQSLRLVDLDSVEYIDDNSCGGVNDESSSFSPSSSTTTAFFPSLKYLQLKDISNLKGWWRSKLGEDEEQSTANNQEEQQLLSHPSFPCLVESNISYCPQLTSMPLQPTVVKLIFQSQREVRPTAVTDDGKGNPNYCCNLIFFTHSSFQLGGTVNIFHWGSSYSAGGGIPTSHFSTKTRDCRVSKTNLSVQRDEASHHPHVPGDPVLPRVGFVR
ncbi:putative disease resistance protein RGA3 [Cornus florida]|uniref:putative disease resistance protein RGA3 n=1 Tax=Cornus florida TaxID=4283 RepID=UPI0028970F11|nr:putative disease resistance protein RGA3 [Cornus florida]